MKKIGVAAFAAALLLAGCSSEADVAAQNIATEAERYLAIVTGILGAIGIVAWLIWALVGRNMDSEVAKHTACYQSGGTMSVVNGSRVCVERPSTGEVPQ